MSVKTFKTDVIVCNGNIIMSVKTFKTHHISKT
jgi:hypothetical protein